MKDNHKRKTTERMSPIRNPRSEIEKTSQLRASGSKTDQFVGVDASEKETPFFETEDVSLQQSKMKDSLENKTGTSQVGSALNAQKAQSFKNMSRIVFMETSQKTVETP